MSPRGAGPCRSVSGSLASPPAGTGGPGWRTSDPARILGRKLIGGLTIVSAAATPHLRGSRPGTVLVPQGALVRGPAFIIDTFLCSLVAAVILGGQAPLTRIILVTLAVEFVYFAALEGSSGRRSASGSSACAWCGPPTDVPAARSPPSCAPCCAWWTTSSSRCPASRPSSSRRGASGSATAPRRRSWSARSGATAQGVRRPHPRWRGRPR